MLAIISDLHFCDGTATMGNVAPEVFALALREIHDLAAKIALARDMPTRVDLVFLGDIFDLLRTERWLEDADGNPVPLAERPWGSRSALDGAGIPAPVAARARGILSDILALNAEALATIRGEREPAPPGVEVRRIYIPGNHDRLYLHDPGLRAGILGALGAADAEMLQAPGIFLHRLEMPEYGTIARHGHEWDVFNFPRFDPCSVPSADTDADYLPTPIGDAVTTEMAVALPRELRLRLLDSTVFSAEVADSVIRRMKRIEDVRPLFASFHWSYYEVSRVGAELSREQAHVLEAALDETVRALARRFRDLDFYQAWQEQHHEALHIDAALLVRLVLLGLSAPTWFPVEWFAERIERLLVGMHPRTVTRRGASYENLSRVGSDEMRFVIYGHTHGPEHVPLRGTEHVQDVYLNTGTYRPGVFRADDGEGFVGWQRIAYTCIASREEAVHTESPFGLPNVGPAFVAWAGARSTGAPSRAGDTPATAPPGSRERR